MISAVIFDLDGVLIDSEPVQFAAFRELSRRRGAAIQEEEFRPLAGRRTNEILAAFRENYGWPDELNTLRFERDDIYEEQLPRAARPLPGAQRLVRGLLRLGLRLGLASSSSLRDIELSLALLGLADSFEAKASAEEVVCGKPNPDVYIRVLGLMRVPAHECIAVEDSGVGVAAAVSAGIRTIAVPNNTTKDHDFSLAHYRMTSLDSITPKEFLSLVTNCGQYPDSGE